MVVVTVAFSKNSNRARDSMSLSLPLLLLVGPVTTKLCKPWHLWDHELRADVFLSLWLDFAPRNTLQKIGDSTDPSFKPPVSSAKLSENSACSRARAWAFTNRPYHRLTKAVVRQHSIGNYLGLSSSSNYFQMLLMHRAATTRRNVMLARRCDSFGKLNVQTFLPTIRCNHYSLYLFVCAKDTLLASLSFKRKPSSLQPIFKIFELVHKFYLF